MSSGKKRSMPKHKADRRRFPARRLVTPAHRKAVATSAVVAVLALTLLGGPAGADELEDKKAELEQRIGEVQESIEFLDADIAETIAQLSMFEDQLPGARERLSKAQDAVAAATREVEALAARVELAEQTKSKINEQLELDQAELAKTNQMIGQIATAAYKSGGVPSNLSLFFGASNDGSLADTIGLADQALRSQAAALDRLAQQHATNVNSEARLAAVETEIKALKEKADAALALEKQARDEAAAEKAKVDKLIADTTALSEKLQAQKPKIQAKLAQVEKEHQQVQADIAEKQRLERLAWEREQERIRKAKAAAAKAEAARQAQIEADRRAAAKANRPAPPEPAPAPEVNYQDSSPSSFGLRMPVGGGIPMTSGFGWRPTPYGTIDFNGTGGYMHTGLDFGASCGTPVYAPAGGTVWYSDASIPSGGNRVVITHGVVGGNALSTIYYHLSSSAVNPGQRVNQGDVIAYVGRTGNSTGCHLHFETMLNGNLVNPLGLL